MYLCILHRVGIRWYYTYNLISLVLSAFSSAAEIRVSDSRLRLKLFIYYHISSTAMLSSTSWKNTFSIHFFLTSLLGSLYYLYCISWCHIYCSDIWILTFLLLKISSGCTSTLLFTYDASLFPSVNTHYLNLINTFR